MVAVKWYVGFDDERIASFDDEASAVKFAEFDSQLEDTTAVVTRHEDDGTAVVVATFVRTPTSKGSRDA